MDRGTIPQQHPVQDPLFSHPIAKPFELLACALRAPVALAEGVGELLVLRQVLHHSFRGALHDERHRRQACDRLLVHIALACPQLLARRRGEQRCEMCLDR